MKKTLIGKNVIAKGKSSQVAKIIQDFACPKLGIPRINSNKYNLEQVIQYLTFPTALTEGFKVHYKNEIYRAAKHAKNHWELSDKIAGRRRPRKLNRILGQALEAKEYGKYHAVLSFYKIHKGIIDVNHFYKQLEESDHKLKKSQNLSFSYWYMSGVPVYPWKIAHYRKFLRVISKSAQLDTLKVFINSAGSNTYLSDTVRQWYPNRDKIGLSPEYNTLRKIHDYVSKEYRKLQTKDFSLIDNIDAEVIEALDGAEVAGMTIRVPKTNYELIEWGQYMHHCIAGYAQRMRNNQCLLLGIEKDNVLTYNVEIRNNRVVQFQGKYNASPDNEDKFVVEKFLLDNKITKKSPFDDLYISPEAMEALNAWQ